MLARKRQIAIFKVIVLSQPGFKTRDVRIPRSPKMRDGRSTHSAIPSGQKRTYNLPTKPGILSIGPPCHACYLGGFLHSKYERQLQ